MERVDSQRRVICLSILGVSRLRKDKPLGADLASV